MITDLGRGEFRQLDSRTSLNHNTVEQWKHQLFMTNMTVGLVHPDSCGCGTTRLPARMKEKIVSWSFH